MIKIIAKNTKIMSKKGGKIFCDMVELKGFKI